MFVMAEGKVLCGEGVDVRDVFPARSEKFGCAWRLNCSIPRHSNKPSHVVVGVSSPP